MKKRLRKKKSLKEFAEFMFIVSFQFDESIDFDEQTNMFEEILDSIPDGYSTGGGSHWDENKDFDGWQLIVIPFYTKFGRKVKSVTDSVIIDVVRKIQSMKGFVKILETTLEDASYEDGRNDGRKPDMPAL